MKGLMGIEIKTTGGPYQVSEKIFNRVYKVSASAKADHSRGLLASRLRSLLTVSL